MMDLDTINAAVESIRGDTEPLLSEIEEKATAAVVLNKPIAVELNIRDARAITRTFRASLETMANLARALCASEQAGQAYIKQIAFLTAQGEEDRRQVKQAIELIEDLRGMSFWQLRKFQREFKRRRPV